MALVGTVQLLGVKWMVEEGVIVLPDTNEKLEVRMLTFTGEEGLTVQVPMPLEMASQVAAALDGRQLIIAKPSGVVRI